MGAHCMTSVAGVSLLESVYLEFVGITTQHEAQQFDLYTIITGRGSVHIYHSLQGRICKVIV
jgi:hypothetical protein